jgi:hypothetical protein
MPKQLKSISFFALPQNATIALRGLNGNEGTARKTQQALQSSNSALKNSVEIYVIRNHDLPTVDQSSC